MEWAQEGSVYSALSPGAAFIAHFLSAGPPRIWVRPILQRGTCSSLGNAASSSMRCAAEHPHPMRMLHGHPGITKGILPSAAGSQGRWGSLGPWCPWCWGYGGMPWYRSGVPGFPGLDGSCCLSLGEQRALVHPEGCSMRGQVVLWGIQDTAPEVWGGLRAPGWRGPSAAPAADCEEAN